MTKEDIRRIVNRHDPMGLIGSGFPEDEYNPEVEEIVACMSEELTVYDLGECLFRIFQNSLAYDEGESLIIDCPAVRARYLNIAVDLLTHAGEAHG